MKLASLVFSVFLVTYVYGAMNEKQMKAAMKLVRNTCQSRTKTPDEQIVAQHNGDFSQGQCYILCLMNSYKLFDADGKFDYEAGIKAITSNAPPSFAEPAVNTFTNCKDAMKTVDDKCIGAAELAKCIYDYNPEMNERQIEAAKKLMRNTCMTRTKTPNEHVDAQHKGDFSQGHFDADGNFDYEGSMKIISTTAPPRLVEIASTAMGKCKDWQKTSDDKCFSAMEFAKCIYDVNPAEYFLP